MKRKVVSLLLMATVIGSCFIGCGSSGIGQDMYLLTEEAEKPENVGGYFEENNFVVEGAGVFNENEFREFPFVTSIQSAKKDGKILDSVKHSMPIGIYEKVEGNTKTIIIDWGYPSALEDNLDGIKEHYTLGVCGFVDRYTVICYIADKQLTPKTTISVEEKEYELSFDFNQEDTVITVTCPIDYDGAAFFVCGANEKAEKENEKNVDKFISISEIKHGDYDMKFFAY